MFAATVYVALTGIPLIPAVPEPRWLSEYHAARHQGRQQDKPLAVFIGSGKAGWDQLSREGHLDTDVKRLLSDNYVCLYVDTDEKAGRRLAAAFDIPDGPGLVISNQAGHLQAFRHEGDLDNQELGRFLQRFADPDRETDFTETLAPSRVSFYGAPPAPPAPIFISGPPMGGFVPAFGGGRGC